MEDDNSKQYIITVSGGGKNREIRLSTFMFNFGILSLMLGIFIFIGACAYSVFSALHYRQNIAALNEVQRAGEMQQEQLLVVSKKANSLNETLQNLAQQEEELRIQAGLDKPAKEDKIEDRVEVDTPAWIPPESPVPQSAWIAPTVDNPHPEIKPQSAWIPPEQINNGQGGPIGNLSIADISEELAMLEKRAMIRTDSLEDFQNELKLQREQIAMVMPVPSINNSGTVIFEGSESYSGFGTFDLSSFGGTPAADPTMPSIWPTNGVVSSPYGLRWGGTDFHPGIDIANDMGTPIVATADGIVEYAGWNSGGYGNMVDINHGNGIMTRYGHASQVVVTAGQYVKRGQLIAYMGSTGFSTGPHVHYEVHVNGQRVNPISYL